MNSYEIANSIVSIISIFIALIALCQTNRQIVLSNKQKLFDRRLSCLLEFSTIYNLYEENKIHLKCEDTFCGAIDLVFSWLTNCSELEEMVYAVSKPLHHEEQKVFLTKIEQLQKSAVEISMIFEGDVARIGEEFILTFADLLKAMYQQQVFITGLEKQKDVYGKPMDLDIYQSKCRETARNLGLFEMSNKLERLSDEITRKQIIEKMKNSLCLTKVK